jgi:haloalkane dehalogenase
MEVYRTPDERFEGLPAFAFEPRYLEQDGLRMHYLDEGSGHPVLLLHGEPTWSFLYRKMIPVLARQARCIAPDYFGFGRSDKPVPREFYTYDTHCESIIELVTRLDLSEITVVMQDWGGPIGMHLAADHPERVSRLVALNTGIFSGRPPSEGWLRFRAFVRRVGTELRPGQLVRITCPRPIDDEVVAGYDAPHPVPESKTGVVMFPELVPDAPDHPSAARMLEVRDAIKRWVKPALVLFGDSDPVFVPAAAHAMAARIPGAGPAEFVAGAGHFVQEDEGEAVARRIVAFLDETR